MKFFLSGILTVAFLGVSGVSVADTGAAVTAALQTKPVPKDFLTRGPGLRSYLRFAGGKKPTRGVFSLGKRRLPYTLVYEPNEKTAGKIIIDWNTNNNFDDDAAFDMPEGNTPKVQSVTLNGVERKFALFAIRRSNYLFLMVRPAEWLEGSVILDGQAKKMVLVDTGFDGVDTTGGDFLLMDVNGDGEIKMSPGMEGLTPLQKNLMLPEGLFTFSYDKGTQKATMTPSSDVGKLAVSYPSTWNNVRLNGFIRTAAGTIGCPFKANVAILPADTYKAIRLTVQGESGNGTFSLFVATKELTIKKGETTQVKIEKPTGVAPQTRVAGNSIRVRESLTFDTVPADVDTKYSMRFNGKRVPPPKVDVYKGDVKLVQATMKYG